LRTALAPHLRVEHVRRATATNDGDIGAVCDLIRRADLSMIENVGVFYDFKAQRDDERDDGDSPAPLGELIFDERAPDDAFAPDGFDIVEAPPPLVEERTVSADNKHTLVKTNDHLAFLGTTARPTKVLVWFDGALGSTRRGWCTGDIVKHTTRKKWRVS